MQLCWEKNCYSDFWHTSARILAFLKPTAKQITMGKMGLTKTKSRYNKFKSWLKDAPKIPYTNILSKGSVPTAILPGILWQWGETTYLITDFSNETPTGLITILGTEVLAIFPFIHTFPLSCWSFLPITIKTIPHPWFTFKPHQN